MNLANISLFRGASDEDLDAIKGIGTHRDAIAGDHLFSPDHAPDALLFIELGSIELTAKGKDTRVLAMGSGQLLGEGAFFAGGKHEYNAVAKETTRLIAFPFDALRSLLEQRPSLALVVYRNAARRFAEVLRNMAPLLDKPYV